MKKYKIFLVAFVSLFTFCGCYDLDRYPADQLSSGTFFKTQDHADQAMMAVYSAMQYWDIFGRQFGFDCLGAIGMGYDAPAYPSIQRGTYTTSETAVTDKFKYLYEGISRANVILQNVDGIDMSDDLKTRYRAEARFMRGLFYFVLLDYWGGVPIYDESLVVADDFSNMLSPRSSADEVRDFILKDMDAAISALPAEWDQANYGRATSGAAMALKGKVYLYNKQYNEAATCFERVTNSGKYALYSDYENLFKPGGDESSEMIFAMQAMGGIGTSFGIPTTFFMGTRSSYGSCWNNVMAATEFVDSYEYADGRPFNWDEVIPGFTSSADVKDKTFRATLSEDQKTVVSYPEAKDKLLEMYEKRDPRMAISVILPYTMYKGNVGNVNKDCEYVIATGVTENNGFIRVNQNYETYVWRKFVAEYDMDGQISDRKDTPINFPIIRYADVLLMLAECYNETGKLADAVGLVNQVRNRVGMPGLNSGPEWLKVNTKDEMFRRIKHEREVELAAEGHSFSDMRRWGILEETARDVVGLTGKVYYQRVVRERDYLWPIPQTEMDRNSNLVQNTGW